MAQQKSINLLGNLQRILMCLNLHTYQDLADMWSHISLSRYLQMLMDCLDI
jgi:hypothetical protein